MQASCGHSMSFQDVTVSATKITGAEFYMDILEMFDEVHTAINYDNTLAGRLLLTRVH